VDHKSTAPPSKLPCMQREAVRGWFAETAFDLMVSEADRCAPYETGGVLMGYWSDDPRALVVVESVGPGPEADHRLASFAPDHVYQEAEIERIYLESGRRITYLGDWHTHPNGIAALSLTDRITQVRIARNRDARAPNAVMAILAGGSPSWTLGVWQLQTRRFWTPAFVPLAPILFVASHETQE
jgi:integrative and conjugative element protein (TIGR02256 family)